MGVHWYATSNELIEIAGQFEKVERRIMRPDADEQAITAHIIQQSFIGDPTKLRLGDRIITNVELFDDSDIKVGTGAGVCTICSVPPLDTLEECLLTVVFAEGQIILGGVAPLPTVGASAELGILGGTGDFSKARGEGRIVLTEQDVVDTTLTLK